MATSKAKLDLDFLVQDAVSTRVVADVTARLCSKLDLECSSPVDTTMTDDSGRVQFKIEPLFEGYIELSKDAYDPVLLFVPRLLASTTLPFVPFATIEDSKRIALLGHELEPGMGRILTTIYGCDMEPVGGISLTGQNMGDNAVSYYTVDNFPTFTATQTDATGTAGFINVTPGSITLDAKLDDGREVAKVSLFVRPEHLTVRHIQPWVD